MQTTKAPKLKTKRSKISYAKWGYVFIAPFFLAYAKTRTYNFTAYRNCSDRRRSVSIKGIFYPLTEPAVTPLTI